MKIEHFVLTAVKTLNIVLRRTGYFLLLFCTCVLLSNMQFCTEVELVLEYRMFHLTDRCWCDV